MKGLLFHKPQQFHAAKYLNLNTRQFQFRVNQNQLFLERARQPSTPASGVLSEMAWSIKGDVKNIFFPPPGARYSSRHPALSPLEDAGVVSCPGFRLFHLSGCIFFSDDDADQF